MHLLVLLKRHLEPAHHQHRAEQVDNPVKPLHQRHARRDEHRPHHQRAKDAPEQHFVLILRGHLEVGEDQEEDEQVVHAQRQFYQVAGEEFQALVAGRASARRPR